MLSNVIYTVKLSTSLSSIPLSTTLCELVFVSLHAKKRFLVFLKP